jgi:hypothetical protein
MALAAANGSRAEEFVFETGAVRLVIGSDGMAASLVEKSNGKQRLSPERLAFAAIRKGGQLFPASAFARRAAGFHVTFGTSGVEADYRITAQRDYILVELLDFQGTGIEEVRLAQLRTPLANAGGLLGARWDDDFTVSVSGLSERVNARVEGPVAVASVYPEFGVRGERVAIIAAPTPRFLDAVQKVERDFQIPSPRIGGKWAKESDDARTSYLFTDLTETNVDETIRYARLGGFRYILVYSDTWSTSLGSYPINTRSFPSGESGLKAVIDKCHAAGLKIGMHMLTSFVGKNDPLVRPKPDPRLLKDAEAMLGAGTDEKATQLDAASPLSGFPLESGAEAAREIVIDDEIIQYRAILGAKFLQCLRGFAGTRPAPHEAGAKIYHLAERGGPYLADLKTSLADFIADRVAGVINRCGFDMIYFDGGEFNYANGPAWYWVGPQQMKIWERSRRELLVQGSGMTSWTWHIFTRGTCDDFAAVAVKEYLDHHKIADSWRNYRDNFLPAELGWWGFLEDTPDHPATTPDEVEYYAVRMLALDSAASLETNLKALKANGRTGEMLTLLGDYERLRLGGIVPKAVRERLTRGEWHMTRPGEFHPIRYDSQRVAVPGEVTLKNAFQAQPLKFRLKALPALAAAGDLANIPLLRAQPPIEIQPPDAKAAMPGALAQRVEFTRAAQDQPSVLMVGPQATAGAAQGTPLNLLAHRALAVRLEVEGPPVTGEPPVLNVQLEAGGKTYRDYYIDLDFRGPKTVILAEPGTARTLAEFPPTYVNYPFKAAMYQFNYGNLVALNLRWMRYPKGSGVRCRISFVEALAERDIALRGCEISAGGLTAAIPGDLRTGDYAEYWADGQIRVFDRNGVLRQIAPMKHSPSLAPGVNRLTIKAQGPSHATFTSITLNENL